MDNALVAAGSVELLGTVLSAEEFRRLTCEEPGDKCIDPPTGFDAATLIAPQVELALVGDAAIPEPLCAKDVATTGFTAATAAGD